MLCCGLIALVVAAALGAWRFARSHRRALLALAAGLLAAGPLAALAAGAGEVRSGGEPWALAMRSICGAAAPTLKPGVRS